MARRRASSGLPGGLRILPPNAGQAVVAVVLAILGVSLFILALDAWLFRHSLPAGYVRQFTSPLDPRMLQTCLLAAIEEVKFRLIVMTGLTALVAALCGRRVSAAWFVAIILAAQAINVGGLVLADPLYASLRYWLVGSVWGWLYWRHGFLAALAGHGLCHLVLDPLLLWGLQP